MKDRSATIIALIVQLCFIYFLGRWVYQFYKENPALFIPVLIVAVLVSASICAYIFFQPSKEQEDV